MNNCRRHPDRPIFVEDMGDRFCKECFFEAWNAGARHADAHWADDPQAAFQYTPHGERIGPLDREHMHGKHTIDRSKDE